MIDDKKIAEAASKYSANANGDYIAATEAEDGFKAGVRWAINELLKDLWHDGREIPKHGRNILVLASFDHEFYSVNYFNVKYLVRDPEHNDSDFIERKDVVRWLYIDDLLPKKGGV